MLDTDWSSFEEVVLLFSLSSSFLPHPGGSLPLAEDREGMVARPCSMSSKVEFKELELLGWEHPALQPHLWSLIFGALDSKKLFRSGLHLEASKKGSTGVSLESTSPGGLEKRGESWLPGNVRSYLLSPIPHPAGCLCCLDVTSDNTHISNLGLCYGFLLLGWGANSACPRAMVEESPEQSWKHYL